MNQKCIRNHVVSYEQSRRHDIDAKNVVKERIIQLGDVLVNSTGTGTLGRVAQVRNTPPEQTTVDSHVTIVRPKPHKFFPEFFGYMLIFIEDAIKESGEGCGGQTELARTVLAEKFSICYPNAIPEQQRIVTILDNAFEGIATAVANAEKNLTNAREFFESYLQTVFSIANSGWKECRLGDVFYIGSSKRVYESEWTSSGVPFYGGKEIVKLAMGESSVVSNAYISEQKYKELASEYDMPQEGDILMTARGTIGVGYVVRDGDKFYYKDGNLISYRRKIPTNPLFILFAFRSKLVGDQLSGLTGATVSHLPIEKAKELRIRLPALNEQNYVTEHLKEIENYCKALERIYQQKIDALAELKKSILHQAFTGQLH